MMRIALLLVALHASADAGGFGIPELGLRETAMGAVIGRPDDGSAIYHNPAGLVLSSGWHVYASFGLVLPRTTLGLAPWPESDRVLGTMPESDGYYAPVEPNRAYAVLPILAVTGELLHDRLYGGVAVYVGNATGATFDPDGLTRYHLVEGWIVAPQLAVAAAYRLRDDLSLGAMAGIVNMRVHGRREIFPIIDDLDVSPIIGTRAKLALDGSGWAPTWSVAAYGRPHPRVTWGAGIVGRVDTTLDGPIEITFSDDAQVPGDMLVGRHRTSMLLPWSAFGGANVDVSPDVEVGVEARYWLYRQYERQHSDVVGIFFLRELDTAKNYHDSWQVSGGARWRATPRLDVMAGINYDTTPEPPTSLTLDEPLFTHYGIHAGARFTFGRYQVGASYTHYWYVVPTVRGSTTLPPTNLRGDGDTHIMTVSIDAAL